MVATRLGLGLHAVTLILLLQMEAAKINSAVLRVTEANAGAALCIGLGLGSNLGLFRAS